MKLWCTSIALLIIASLHIHRAGGSYLVDDVGGIGRRFDGIGGLSGGGVSACSYS